MEVGPSQQVVQLTEVDVSGAYCKMRNSGFCRGIPDALFVCRETFYCNNNVF